MSSKSFNSYFQNYLRARLPLLRWLIPLFLFIIVLIYVLGPANWLHTVQGATIRTIADLIVFGTIGPIFALIILYFLERWLEERDTANLQAHILNKFRADINNGRELHDHSIQVLFAASILLDTFKSEYPDLPEETAVQIEKTDVALNQAIEQLRDYLVK